jgi:predicted AlkP superfamily pyrophosphatase or phosphodiesterase
MTLLRKRRRPPELADSGGVRRPNVAPGRRVVVLSAGVLVLAALALLFACAFSARGTGRHVLVISVDGMGSSYYMQPCNRLKTPSIRRLMAEGSFAEAVEGVYPTLTYPSHTTIVTGRRPAEHGIYTNLSSRQSGKNPDDWFWFARAIKATTLWDEARAHHMTSAAVAWPVTVGAAIDWDVPEIWNPIKGQVPDPFYVVRFVNPMTTLELAWAMGIPHRGSEDDANRTKAASYFFTRHHPNLVLLHLEALDAAEHRFGPHTPQANSALERADVHIGEMLSAVKQAGLESSTDVVVLSDHGFLSVDRAVRPNVLLARAGLLTADSKGKITGGRITTVVNDGSFFLYWPQGSDLRAEVDSALKPLCDQGLVQAVFGQEALHEMGADPEARLAVEAPAGVEYTAEASGPLVQPLDREEGAHGFLPSRQGLESSFIARGPDIRSGVNLHRIQLTEIGPTILDAMGIRDPKFGDRPPLDVIFQREPRGPAERVP